MPPRENPPAAVARRKSRRFRLMRVSDMVGLFFRPGTGFENGSQTPSPHRRRVGAEHATSFGNFPQMVRNPSARFLLALVIEMACSPAADLAEPQQLRGKLLNDPPVLLASKQMFRLGQHSPNQSL